MSKVRVRFPGPYRTITYWWSQNPLYNYLFAKIKYKNDCVLKIPTRLDRRSEEYLIDAK